MYIFLRSVFYQETEVFPPPVYRQIKIISLAPVPTPRFWLNRLRSKPLSVNLRHLTSVRFIGAPFMIYCPSIGWRTDIHLEFMENPEIAVNKLRTGRYCWQDQLLSSRRTQFLICNLYESIHTYTKLFHTRLELDLNQICCKDIGTQQQKILLA